MKLWAGRFSKETDEKVNDFNSSISFDCKMYAEDIEGSLAHAEMLGKQGIISVSSVENIKKGLISIKEDLESGKLEFDMTAEDIHMFIEAELTKRIGDDGKRLHTARSRNDQVALDVRLYTVNKAEELITYVKELIAVLCEKAEEHSDTVMPGYTHLQRAQPISFGHHLMAYAQMLLRDIDRMSDSIERTKVSPLGSCALAGTTYPLDRDFVAQQLGFNSATANSLDGVSDRDFCIELISDISILMMHLSRLSEEIILWCSWEFKFIELDDAFSTGSSIMPQKKNPDVAELVRGKTGRVYGDLITLLTAMKGLPLAYNKDMQEDKEALFDAIDTAKLCLTTMAPMIKTMTVLKDNMYKAAEKGFINATDCADYLTKKGVPFRDAYKVTGQLVAWCIANDKVLGTVPMDVYKEFCDEFNDDIYEAIKLETCINERKVKGGPCKESVLKQIEEVKKSIK